MADCPTPKRAIYATEGAAWSRIGVPIRELPYRCTCGAWHIGPRAEAMRHRTAGR